MPEQPYLTEGDHFFAVDLPSPLRAVLRPLQELKRKVDWVPHEQFHLTLCVLPALDAEARARLVQEVNDWLPDYGPEAFAVTIDGVAAEPQRLAVSLQSPRTFGADLGGCARRAKITPVSAQLALTVGHFPRRNAKAEEAFLAFASGKLPPTSIEVSDFALYELRDGQFVQHARWTLAGAARAPLVPVDRFKSALGDDGKIRAEALRDAAEALRFDADLSAAFVIQQHGRTVLERLAGELSIHADGTPEPEVIETMEALLTQLVALRTNAIGQDPELEYEESIAHCDSVLDALCAFTGASWRPSSDVWLDTLRAVHEVLTGSMSADADTLEDYFGDGGRYPYQSVERAFNHLSEVPDEKVLELLRPLASALQTDDKRVEHWPHQVVYEWTTDALADRS